MPCRNGGSYFRGYCILQRVDLRYERGNLTGDLLHVFMFIRYLSRYLLHIDMLIRDALSQGVKRN